MNLEQHKSNLKSIQSCPYCNGNITLVSSKFIYRYDMGMIYLCENYPLCNSYVGVHKGTIYPLGRLANHELRTLKTKVHKLFDPLWNYLLDNKKINKLTNKVYTKYEARNSVYNWLATELNIPVGECHVGFFDCDMCNKSIIIIENLYKEKSKLKNIF